MDINSKFSTFLEGFRNPKNSNLLDTILEGFEYIYHPDPDDPNPYAQSPAFDKAEGIFNSFQHRIPQKIILTDKEEEMVEEICKKFNVTTDDIKYDYMVNHLTETPYNYLTRVLTNPEVNEFEVRVRYVEDDHEYEGKIPAKYRDDKEPDSKKKRNYDNANAM